MSRIICNILYKRSHTQEDAVAQGLEHHVYTVRVARSNRASVKTFAHCDYLEPSFLDQGYYTR